MPVKKFKNGKFTSSGDFVTNVNTIPYFSPLIEYIYKNYVHLGDNILQS